MHGVGEFSNEMTRYRGKKPVIAVANSLCASAAYWIACAADEVVVTPSGEVGSIGVYATHQDVSRMLDKAGVIVSLISAGKYKTEGSSYSPLGDEARAHIQSRVDDYYGMFVRDVARNRKETQTNVRNGYGEGRVLGAQAAIKAGLADRQATLNDVVAGLMAKGANGGSRARSSQGAHLRLAAAERELSLWDTARPEATRKSGDPNTPARRSDHPKLSAARRNLEILEL